MNIEVGQYCSLMLLDAINLKQSKQHLTQDQRQILCETIQEIQQIIGE